jgi:hypothetical protein
MDLEQIKDRIASIARSGGIGELIQDVEVEVDHDEDDTDFLDVVITLKPTKKNVDAELIKTIERVEDAVAEIDPRYPSVRFLDAA